MQNRKVDHAERPDPLRRRLAKGGLAIPVVLSTLGSRPVFGEVAYNCTISGQMSGNTSAHGPPVVCAIGNSPNTYLANGGSELDIAFNSLSSGGSTLVNAIESVVPTADPATGTTTDTATDTAGGVPCNAPTDTVSAPEVVPPTNPKQKKGKKLKDARGALWKDSIKKPKVKPKAWTDPKSISQSSALFTPVVWDGGHRERDKRKGRNQDVPATSPAAPEINIQPRDACGVQQGTTPSATEPTVVVDARDRRVRGRRAPATLRQVLKSNDGGIMPLARATIASYLNAKRFAPNYPLTPKQVIDMFNAVYTGGTYRVNDSTFWTANDVQAYFETLYR